MHRVANPAILYFGTPVVLVSTLNEDGSANLAPMSSAWWLGWNCMLGFGARSKTPQNLIRTGECVLNLPSVDMAAAVNRLARTTGSDPVPEHKVRMGYRHEADKFGTAEITPVESEIVAAPRAAECPVQMEAVLQAVHPLEGSNPLHQGRLVSIEVKIVRVYLEDRILMDGCADRIDPAKWRPLIMSFCQFFGLGPMVHHSTLAEIPESAYRTQGPGTVPSLTAAAG
jgi:flavin reductase (DIM6/NTAB) family NADH-FMN oxidoreductase RutF